MHVMEYYLALKEGSADMRCNMDEPWRQYAKWNKAVWLHLCAVLGVFKLKQTESRMMVAGVWGKDVMGS